MNKIDFTDLQLHYLDLDEYICENIYPINKEIFTEKINWLKGVAYAAGAIGLGFLLKWILQRYNINQAAITALSVQQTKNKQITAQIVNQTNALDNLSEEEKANKAAAIVIQYLLSSNALNDSLRSSINSLNAEDLKTILITIEREKSYCDQTKTQLEQLQERLNAKTGEIVSQKLKLDQKDEDLTKRSTELDTKAADIEAREKKIDENEKKLRQDLDSKYQDYYNKQVADIKQEYDIKNTNREAEHQQKINEIDKEKELINSQKKEIENKNQELQQRKQSLDEYDSNLSSARDELEKRAKAANLKDNELKDKEQRLKIKDDELKGKEKSLKDEDLRLNAKRAAVRADNNLIEKGSKYDAAIKQINKLTKDLDETESQLTASVQRLILANGIIENIGKELDLTIEQIQSNPDSIKNKIQQINISNATIKIQEIQQNQNQIDKRISTFERVKQSSRPKSPLRSDIEPSSKKIDLNSIIVIPKSTVNKLAIDECQLLTILNNLVRNVNIFITNLQIESNNEEFKKLVQENLKSNQTLESFNKELNNKMTLIYNNINSYILALIQKYIHNQNINEVSVNEIKINYSDYFNNTNFLNKFDYLNKLSNLTEKESYLYFINDNFKELPRNNNIKIAPNLVNLSNIINKNLAKFIKAVKEDSTKSILLTYLKTTLNKSILDDYLK